MREQFTALVPRAITQFVSEKVSNRLRNALESEDQSVQSSGSEDSQSDESGDQADRGVVTTEEEIEGFRIVTAIVCKVVAPSRVAHRDTKSYMGILLDDNNRKPICRLWFNTKQRYLGVFDSDKNESRIPIESVAGIYAHADHLLATVREYEGQVSGHES
jgi:predicted type IV restriction endonuclease